MAKLFMNYIEKLLYDYLTKTKEPGLLLQKLLIATLKTPAVNLGDVPSGEKWHTLEQDVKVGVKVEKRQDYDWLVAFTSDKYFQEYLPEGGEYIAMKGKTAFETCLLNKFSGLIINAKSKLEFVIPKEQLQSILDRN